MSEDGKRLADVLSDAIAAFDHAAETIRLNDYRVSEGLLDSMQSSFNAVVAVVAVARTMEHVL